jgi:hypothetical protein
MSHLHAREGGERATGGYAHKTGGEKEEGGRRVLCVTIRIPRLAGDTETRRGRVSGALFTRYFHVFLLNLRCK